jgi:alpha-amylase
LASDLNTRYGSEQELRDLCRELTAAGIHPMADIVINHRCADTQDANGNWRIFSNVTFPDAAKSGAGDGLNFDKSWGPWWGCTS